MPSAPDPPDPLIGRELIDKYRVLARLGAGGFGTVYSALNLDLGTEVAIKVSHDPGSDARALREARAASRLRSPYSVRVFDVGRVDGALFIVMEPLPGRSLRRYLREQGPLPVELASKWLSQVCGALHEAHSLGFLHRDVKPSNLFVVEATGIEPHLKLLDFGIAKSLDAASGSDATDSGQVLGSPSYMAPEQVRGAQLTHHVDVWGLGVVLYECLSGRLPFERESASAVLVAIAAEPATPLDAVARHLPEPVIAIVDRCLRKAPLERFASAQVLGDALSELAGRRDEPSTPTETASRPFASEERALLESASTQQSLIVSAEQPGSPYRKLASFGLLALLAAVLVWFLADRAHTGEGAHVPSAGVPELSLTTNPVPRPPIHDPKLDAPPAHVVTSTAPSHSVYNHERSGPKPSAVEPTAPRRRATATPGSSAPAPSGHTNSRLVLDPDF
jgi:serine/threonine protein kinase